MIVVTGIILIKAISGEIKSLNHLKTYDNSAKIKDTKNPIISDKINL